MNERERMLANLPYRADRGGLPETRMACQAKCWQYNQLDPRRVEERRALMRDILGKTGEHFWVEAPFHCDYGFTIEVGEWFYSNYNLVVLDTGHVKIGDCAMLGPNVTLCTAGHPLHPDSRNSGYEYGIDITIGDNVWIGAGCIVNPGVTVGDNVVIGAGSVVTRDLPANVVAAGAPCRVLRPITEEDRDFYFKKRRFDVEDYR